VTAGKLRLQAVIPRLGRLEDPPLDRRKSDRATTVHAVLRGAAAPQDPAPLREKGSKVPDPSL